MINIKYLLNDQQM